MTRVNEVEKKVISVFYLKSRHSFVSNETQQGQNFH
jgi:hypothetical protein